MIEVNGKTVEHDGPISVASLLERMGFVWPMIVVRLNGKLVKRERYKDTQVSDGDTVDVIHMMSGG
jgi:thiamine biosynthesis protein ThiS